MPRTLLESQKIYTGAVFEITRDRLLEENGHEVIRDVVQHPGGAGGVPVFADGRIALVRQYRHPARQELLETPAGKIDAGETPEVCAAREIEEELGWCEKRGCGGPGKMASSAVGLREAGFFQTTVAATRRDVISWVPPDLTSIAPECPSQKAGG